MRPPPAELAIVRRFEAAGFRAWPAETAQYDGTWLLRLDSGHAAKRLNSVNPLDPGDATQAAARVERAAQRFTEAHRPLTFRMSPLGGDTLEEHFDREGWSRFGHSIVMRRALDEDVVADALDQIPLKDGRRFTAALARVQGARPDAARGLQTIIERVPAEAGLFLIERDGIPLAGTVCVHDGELAGLFEVATHQSVRGQGFGRRIALSALKWARGRGARQAWLQVEADNAVALGLYGSLGFGELYRYSYRRPPA
ncbi:MAG: GNAT family N-acetyltransferase [Mesorhizobium amorphae]|nr:MAG: GNAT family N-acetyltransferase [Mesorhizobium amorphae]